MHYRIVFILCKKDYNYTVIIILLAEFTADKGTYILNKYTQIHRYHSMHAHTTTTEFKHFPSACILAFIGHSENLFDGRATHMERHL